MTNMKNRKLVIMFTVCLAMSLMFSACNTDNSNHETTSENEATNNGESTSDSTAINYEEKIEKEGLSDDEIESFEAYVNRIVFQLNEIQTFNSISTQSDLNTTDDSIKYSELLSKIDTQKAVYFLIKLKDDFNNMEEIFNEYLLSLQLNLDIYTYLDSKNKYIEKKDEMLSEIEEDIIITVSKIEEKAFENLQKLNEENKNINSYFEDEINNSPGNIEPDDPSTNLPEVDVPVPADPTEDLKNNLPGIN
ncbi:hypothetical protein RBH29_03455 [Herbivorax sp. ANBcel31]|uniref:hypothetical protein n=1 Tax=Herbivorax sp. ANBcel31 TaxID=3069754 RepID=UPI0027B7C20E|nr:hypothetical protein [Herbivorax sp. ANBcel31]MDQ2085488.1 hypothetical protein [Herbivorax sp. ANBcel31]